jgi:sulfur carrier protein
VSVIVNGERRELAGTETVAELVAGLGRDGSGRGLAVAVNGEVVTRAEWSTRVLEDGDRVEILRAVGGG